MTSQSNLPKRLMKIDNLTRIEHKHLRPDDDCFFFGEYAAGKRYDYSDTNQWIFNFKKPVDSRGQRHKKDAIRTAAGMFRQAIKPDALNRTTFVPIPPSKSKEDPVYDGRLLQMLRLIRPNPRLDIRELLVQSYSVKADHESNVRRSPKELEQLWKLDHSLTGDTLGECLAIVDDVLTNGSHFRAAKSILSCFNVKIIGLFLARTVHDTIFE